MGERFSDKKGEDRKKAPQRVVSAAQADDVPAELHELLQKRRGDVEAAFGRRRWREKMSMQPFGSLLGLFFKGRPDMLRKVDENSALMTWKEVVGETAATFSEATRFRGNTLVVRVKDAIWMQQLSLLKTSLLKAYQKRFPGLGIKDIYFTRS